MLERDMPYQTNLKVNESDKHTTYSQSCWHRIILKKPQKM